jgi:hypothetical protein
MTLCQYSTCRFPPNRTSLAFSIIITWFYSVLLLQQPLRTGVSVTYPPLIPSHWKSPAVARGSTPRFGMNHLTQSSPVNLFLGGFGCFSTILLDVRRTPRRKVGKSGVPGICEFWAGFGSCDGDCYSTVIGDADRAFWILELQYIKVCSRSSISIEIPWK